MAGHNVHDKETGKPRILAEQCSTCVFRSGNPMDLRAGRLRDLVNGARRADSFIVCHQTLPGMPGEGKPAICRGFADRYSTNYLRVMERLGGFAEIQPPRKAA